MIELDTLQNLDPASEEFKKHAELAKSSTLDANQAARTRLDTIVSMDLGICMLAVVDHGKEEILKAKLINQGMIRYTNTDRRLDEQLGSSNSFLRELCSTTLHRELDK